MEVLFVLDWCIPRLEGVDLTMVSFFGTFFFGTYFVYYDRSIGDFGFVHRLFALGGYGTCSL
jgi:hypothetical protein